MSSVSPEGKKTYTQDEASQFNRKKRRWLAKVNQGRKIEGSVQPIKKPIEELDQAIDDLLKKDA